jgi:hypothetical protein
MGGGGQGLRSAPPGREGLPRWILVFTVIVLAALLAIALLLWALSKAPDLFGFLGQRELAAVRSEIKVGMSRPAVYARLRARNLIAWSRDSATDGHAVSYPPERFTALGMNGKTYLVTHAEVWVPVGVGSAHFGCGTGVDLTIEFDNYDLVKRTRVGSPHEECM